MRIITLLLMLFASVAFSQTKQFMLDNGLKLVVKEDHRAPVVVSMIWYDVGSSDEPGGLTGISHVLEHLMFKGTKKYPPGTFSKIVAALGGQENAFTSTDYTAYFEKIAAMHLPKSFELEADRMRNLVFDQSEFNKEIKVVQEERRMRTDDNPQALTFERFLAAAHLASPYHHPVIGWMSALKQMTMNDAKHWYQRYYAPNNATLVVVGDVKPEEVHAQAKQYFGSIPKAKLPTVKHQPEPPALGQKSVEVHAPAQVPLLMIGYTVPSVKTASKINADDPYALELIAGLLDAGDSGRLTKNLIRGQQIASNADVHYNPYTKYQSQFILFGSPSQTHTMDDLQQGFMEEIKRLKSKPVDLAELNRIKTQIIAQKTFERDSIFEKAMEIGLLETIGVGWQTADEYVERINKITPLQIQQTATRYFNNKNLTKAQLIPEQNNTKPKG